MNPPRRRSEMHGYGFVTVNGFTVSFHNSIRKASHCQHHRRRCVTRQNIRATAPIEADGETFKEQVLEASTDQPVLVDFHAKWCGPCKLVSPLMDWAATEYEGKLKVVKVDTEDAPQLIKEYKINGLPTLAVFKDGEANAVTEGAVGKKALIKYIDDNVFSE